MTSLRWMLVLTIGPFILATVILSWLISVPFLVLDSLLGVTEEDYW